MAILNVGPNSTYASILLAMQAADPGDIIQLETGYSNDTAQIDVNGLILNGDATNLGIELELGIGVTTFTVTGEPPVNIVDSALGNTITSGGGNNIVTVSAGADTVLGGAGDDRLVVDYGATTGAVTGNSTSNFTDASGAGSVTVTSGFEHFTLYTGSGADTLTTGAGNDIIDAGAGANVINAGAGNNIVSGGIGADTVTTLGGDDEITVRGGADTIVAGGGNDHFIVDYSALVTNIHMSYPSGNLATGHTSNITDTGANTVTYEGIERFTVLGGTGNDSLLVGDGDDILSGGGGDDFLYGGIGTDVALFSGDRSNYSITYNGDVGYFTVVDQRLNGDGTDIVQAVETMRFNGVNYSTSGNQVIAAPVYSIADAQTVTEGGTLVFAITATAASTQNVTVTTSQGNVTILANETSGTLSVPTVDNLTYGPNSDVVVTLTSATGGGTVSSTPASGSVLDNDSAPGGGGGGGGGGQPIDGEPSEIDGNAGANRLISTSADEIFDGQGGTDSVVFTGNYADYTITLGEDGPTSIVGPDGNDQLISIERLVFADGTLAFDDTAEQAHRLYQAAFDRAPDAAGVGYWIRELDAGNGDLMWVANHFIFSQEFRETYGESEAMDDEQFLELMYQNVQGRGSDAGGFTYWMDQLDEGYTRDRLMLAFSESAENVGVPTDAGVWYL
jgi:Ca2+-binding RTX toxin-like protein